MIALEQVGHHYGEAPGVDEVSFTVGAGECVALIGASGCGKSTTLRLINRLLLPDRGRILIDGRDASQIPPEALRRGMGYAIQSTGLFPHWSVARNIGTVPSLLGWPRERSAGRVDALGAVFGLDHAIRDAGPASLSGGQQQRVGLARALASDPPILLMDEPFSALDPITRSAAQNEIARVRDVGGKAIVLVTHDIDEALRLGTRIVVMQAGRIVREATPLALLADPGSPYVRDLVGRAELGLKVLSVRRVGEIARPGEAPDAPAIDAGETLRSALSRMIELGVSTLAVRDAASPERGRRIERADLLRAADGADATTD